MWMVGAHYRKPVAYTEETLEDAARAAGRVRDVVRRLDRDAAARRRAIDVLRRNFFDALVFLSFIPLAELMEWLKEANVLPSIALW